MSNDIPDFMREFDTSVDFGFTPVSSKPSESKSTPAVDTKALEGTNIELAKVKSDVSSIKSMMNEVMQIVSEKETVNKELNDLKKLRKLYCRFYITYQSQTSRIFIGLIEVLLLRHKWINC
jgi:vacuolar-type H+-ATPase subunit I/STV1